MPEEIENKLVWLFILLPGFLSIAIIGKIVDLGQLTEFQITFYSLVLTLVNISIALLIYWFLRLLGRPLSRKNRETAKDKFNKVFFFTVVMLVSIASGILFGLAAEKDVFFVTLRCLPITDTLNKRSSSRPLVFLLSQNTTGKLKEDGDARPKAMKKTEAWVKVRLRSGKQYEGWPEYFGIGDKASELYLSPACEWVSQSSQEVLKPVPGPGIIIFEREIETLTFIDREESKCLAYWFNKPNTDSESEK